MPQKILVVDDDELTVRWLEDVLSRQGYEVSVARTGTEALELTAREQPDLIVLDLILPDLDGLDVCRRIRRELRQADVQIIMLTSRDKAEDIVTGLRAGANDYIPKRPGADQELLAKIRALLAHPQRWTGELDVQGKVVAFTSAKGGVGTTSLCINFAQALAEMVAPQTVLVADLVSTPGSVAGLVGLPDEKESLIDLMTSGRIGLDHQSITRYLREPPGWRIQVLPGSYDPLVTLDQWGVQILIEILPTLFDYVFADVGRTLSQGSLEVLQAAHQIVLILAADMDTVRLTQHYLALLRSLGISQERLFPVLNQSIGREGMSKGAIEDKLGLSIAGTIPHAQSPFVNAANQGKPFIESYPQHVSTMMIRELTQILRERL